MINSSGFSPVGFHVLVLPDPVEERTASGIITKTPAEAKREAMTQVWGTVVALGSRAWEDDPETRARVGAGTRVLHAKWDGLFFQGADGREYRVLQDQHIVAVAMKEQSNG